MNDQTTALPPDNESRIDDTIGASGKIDWDEIIAADDRGDPEEMLGGVVFDSADYATEEEEAAAYEAFIQRVCGGPDEEI
jgi:hypothetical protein